MQREPSSRPIAYALLGVLAVMMWPIWLAVVAAEPTWTWTVAASALIPLAFGLGVIACAMRLPQRLGHSGHEAAHHVNERLHAGTHRHA
jgi:hypothetical protein